MDMRTSLELSDGFLASLEPGILHHLFRFWPADNVYGNGDQGAIIIPHQIGKENLISEFGFSQLTVA